MDKRDFLFRFVPLNQRSKLLMDEESLYSTTDQLTADKISRELLKLIPATSTVTDATACVGGSAYSLSKVFASVNAIELDKTRYEYLVNNIKLLGSENIQCIYGDALEECKNLKQDLIFLDPPWGGPEYKRQEKVSLELSNIKISEVCEKLSPYTKFIAIKAPTNFDETTFNESTKNVLKMVYKNIHLRKMNLLVYEVIHHHM